MNYIALVFADDLKDPDKTIEKSACKELFQDATEVHWDDMARFQLIADPSQKFRVVKYAVDVGEVKKNISVNDVDVEIKDKLSEKNKCIVVACGTNPMADLAAAGFEPILPEMP